MKCFHIESHIGIVGDGAHTVLSNAYHILNVREAVGSLHYRYPGFRVFYQLHIY